MMQARTTRRALTIAGLAGLAGLAMMLGGCLQRTLTVTSEPPGAVVWLNDNEVGRTPVDVDFTYFGKYSVRLRREGYEPVIDVRQMRPPVREWPVVDLVGEALPVHYHTRVNWHYDLEPAKEYRVSQVEAESEMIHSGKQMRASLQGVEGSVAPK